MEVSSGEWVSAGDTIGHSGLDHEVAALHFSVRVGDVYQDPAKWLVCLTEVQPALRLVAVESS
jgi:murein DD-endopeptidase MepM/ murein hydrolase activator NlpD